MKIQQFLEHHGLRCNPFSDEDAQTDPVFKEHCIGSTYHVAWDKIYSHPTDPATSIIFGEKGSGKTALRLQIKAAVNRHNREHPDERCFVIEYDDFNPFLDRFRDKLGRRGKVLANWKLWDHMDAILALAITQVVDAVLEDRDIDGADSEGGPLPVNHLDRWQRRDLLLLAACYDRSPAETFRSRWHRFRKKLAFPTWRAKWDFALGILVTLAVLGVIVGTGNWGWFGYVWPYLFVLAGWGAWLYKAWKYLWKAWGIERQVRVVHHEINALRHVLMQFTNDEIAGQPLPNKERTDDRYELLVKLQGALKSLGYAGIIVLVDRVDEPHLVNGSAEGMRALVWPMLDNKLLKHPGIGFKLLLPIELSHYIDREDRDFYQRARLDKQNMIPSLQWTGEALYDVANARLRACSDDSSMTLRSLFDDSISDRRLIESLRQLRVPRHLFKFMYRLLVAHSNAHTDDQPVWQIGSDTYESTLALYMRDQDAFDRGVGPG